MVVSIILSLIRVIQECHSKRLVSMNRSNRAKLLTSEIQKLSLNKSLINKLRLKKIIKKYMSSYEYKEFGKDLNDAIMDVGSSFTEDEALTIMEALNV